MSAKQYGIPTPIQFDRLYSGPLDKHEVFESYAEALAYSQGSISYAGQVIGVRRNESQEDVYVINENKTLSRLMTEQEPINLVLKATDWVGSCPYEQSLAIPYLQNNDNCIISLSETADVSVVREIVNAKLADTIQEEGSIRFIARGDKPTIDIPITVTIGSIVSAVEIPNNVNDNTNHTVIIAKQDAWQGTKPPYTQELYVFGISPDSMGVLGINPDSPYYEIDRVAAFTAGVQRYDQGNNSITIIATNSKPTRDLELLVTWGDNIVVFENSDILDDYNTTLDLVLKADEWSSTIPYTQTVRVEGLTSRHMGSIGLSENCTALEAEAGLNAELKITEQEDGYVVITASGTKPTIDIPIYVIYGSNVVVVSSPEYIGESNKHIDTIAYASRWEECADGWEQEIDVKGITSNSNGVMNLNVAATDLQTKVAALSNITIKTFYDNKVVLVARNRPNVNIPLSFIIGGNINIIRGANLTGKVTLDAKYIPFDDRVCNVGANNVQDAIDYMTITKTNKRDIVNKVHEGELHEDYIPEEDNILWNAESSAKTMLSARMGRYLYLRKVNYDDIVDNLTSTDTLKPLSANMGKVIHDALTVHDSDVTKHIPSVDGANGKYLMYNSDSEGNRQWHTPNIDGVDTSATGDVNRYSICTTSADSATKIVNCPGFKLIAGAMINVKFTESNVSNGPALKVNDTTATTIYDNGAIIASDKLVANKVYTFIYDGSNYVLIGDATVIKPKSNNRAYITATTSSVKTNISDQVFDPDVYLDTISGKLVAKTIQLSDQLITNNLNATGVTTLKGTTVETLTSTGKATLNELSAGSTTLGSTVIGLSNATKDLTVNGNISVSGTSNLGTVTVGTPTSNKTLTVNGVEVINGNATVNGSLTINGDLAANNLPSDYIIKVQATQPAAVSGKNVIWIKI